MKQINFLIATFFGIGKIPGAPGTWASLAAAPLFWFFIIDKPLWQFGLILIVIYFVGVYTSGKYEKQIGQKDPSEAVIDEVLGMGVAMFNIPHQWPYVVMAFILFRIFDIWKPHPIRRLEQLPAGWGIMTDDLLAGVYAWAWIQIGAFLVNNVLK
jgi:phosphatidylglycerophosphatase A